MKAVVQNAYGSAEYLGIKEVPEPRIGATDVIVRAMAASVNAGDLFGLMGVPWMIRMELGFPRPKDHIPGWDVAGIVASVGRDVRLFKPGDEVYGSTDSAFAEYVAGDHTAFEPKPTNISFAEAAALPTAALTALQRLRDGGNIKSGQRILVLGASGGVGSMAVQIARSFGCVVDGVCHSRKVEMVRSLGAEQVYSYDQDGFLWTDCRYDLILDNTGRNRFADLKRILTRRGLVIPNSGHGGMSYVVKAFAVAPFDKHIGPMRIVDLKKGDLKVISRLVEESRLRPYVDAVFRLDEAAAAFDYLAQGRVRGKIVLSG